MTISEAISKAPPWDEVTVQRWTTLWKEVERQCAPSVNIHPACVDALTQIFPFLIFAGDAETTLNEAIHTLKSMERISAKTALTA